MICSNCQRKCLERRMESIRSFESFYICMKCEISYPPILEKTMQPKSEIAKKSVKEANALIDKLLSEDIKLKILIWGAGLLENSPIAKKRKQIKKSLIEMGHDAKFSEDLEGYFHRTGQALHHNELMHVEWANLVVVINDKNSLGVLGELHDHGIQLNQKSLVWVPTKAREGYTGRGILKQLELQGAKVEFYSEKEVGPCFLMTATKEWVNGCASLIIGYKKNQLLIKKRLSDYGF